MSDEPRVVDMWIKADSSFGCTLCQLVETEIQAVGQFEEEISTLMLVSWRLACFAESATD